ncbi:hypothetical protein PIIN_11396 [Serendipita indica DSM 11827]|uniref:Uncharacterized protein n=1 Tax=Serendipita indica (strain DSM 11827) TaxID=1109443 RepID=G4U1H6_SERID|nr:hypothetical protein PIIN_11396 [Serendipita indica DSM 11827]
MAGEAQIKRNTELVYLYNELNKLSITVLPLPRRLSISGANVCAIRPTTASADKPTDEARQKDEK